MAEKHGGVPIHLKTFKEVDCIYPWAILVLQYNTK